MKIVPPSGPRDAKIMLVGEAPAAAEEKEGAPFVGPAGKQLDRMLAAAGLRRSDIYITNVIKHRIPADDAGKNSFFFQNKAPTKAYMDGILGLLSEINEVSPNVVVPLGNYALWALTQEMNISKWRGSIIEAKLAPGQKIIPTFHPAFYIHGFYAMSMKEPLGIWDFTKIKKESTSPDIILPSANFIINPTPEEIDEAVDRLLSGDHITADTEWYGPEDLAYIGFTNSPEWAICIPFDSMSSFRAYKKILSSPIPKWWQNAMFDVVALSRIGIETTNVQHDTMIAWHSCWADIREKGLDVIGSVLTRWPYYKDALAFVSKRDPKGQIYCCKDCVVTDEVMRRIELEEFDYTDGRRGYEISMSIFNTFSSASNRGLRVDEEKLGELEKDYVEKANYIEDVLSKTIGYTINCRSAPQVKDLVYNQLGIHRTIHTTKQEVLMDIAASTKDETIKAILTAIIRVRQNRNLVSRYINPGVVDKDGRLRTNWNLAGTRSGRLSTTDPWWPGLALQTVPDEFREVVIPDQGTIFIGWDLAQAEARVVAVKTKDYELLQDMDEGVDIHTKLASQLPFGYSYEELSAMCKERGKDNVPERYIAKKCRHALNYAMGGDTFRFTVNKEYLDTGVGLDQTSARNLRNAYLDLHPGLQWWWAQIEQQLKKTQTLTTCFGRKRRFTGFLKNAMTEAISFEPQSTVADLTTLSIAAAEIELKQLDHDSQIFVHMHDGGLIQVREDLKDDAIEIVRRCMTRELIIDRHPLTIPVDVKAGYNWKDMDYV